MTDTTADTDTDRWFQQPDYLVETDWLQIHLADPDLRIFDCTTYLLPDPKAVYRIESGRADWEKGHIPGAGFIDLQGELSDQTTKLRFMMPPADQFAAAMSRLGVGQGVRVILYSAGSIQWATRVWWMLRAMGFDNAAVLNGGWEKWQAEGRPVSTEPPRYPPANFVAKPRPGLFADKDKVMAAIEDGGSCVLNALAAEQHTGAGGRHYGRPGRIAGSVNVPARALVDPETNAYLSPAALRALFEDAGITPDREVVAYCGGGIAASNDAFVLTLLGYDKVSLYDASLSEWARDENLPMETG